MDPMQVRRYAHIALAALALAAAPVAAQQTDRLYFLTEAPVQVAEGDAGLFDAVVKWQIDGTAQREVSFDISTDAPGPLLTYEYVADAGVDYEPIPSTHVVIPAGQRSGTFTVRIRGDIDVEPTQRVLLRYRNIVGAVAPGQLGYVDYAVSAIDIVNDDDPVVMPVVVAHDDHGYVRMQGGPHMPTGIDVFANDVAQGNEVVTAEILDQPQHGTATPGAPDMLSQLSIAYAPNPGYVGPDQFRYRICALGDCSEAVARIDVVYFLPIVERSHHRSGRVELGEIAPVPMPSAAFVASPLVAAVSTTMQVASDPTPATPWDGGEGRQLQRFAFPPLAAGHADWVLAAGLEAQHFAGYDKVDVYVGVDRNGDGQPSRDEMLCATGVRRAICEVPFRQDASVDGWWVMMHSRHSDVLKRVVNAWEVPVGAGDGSLVATGPGHVNTGHELPLTLAWDDDSITGRGMRYGALRILAQDGVSIGDVPVRLEYYDPTVRSTMLAPGITREFALSPAEHLRTVFFDVPAGATRVRLDASATAATQVWLAPHDGSTSEFDQTWAGIAPAAAPADAQTLQAGQSLQLVREGAALAPGRWFAVVRSVAAVSGNATMRVTIDGAAPEVRPGSYFDAERPGSGIFLYPAGGDWAGLWYTYRPDDHSTWYYLQGAAPGANGLWTGGIYRAAWDGDSRILTRVGTAIVAPTGDDAFQLSYTIDGETGTRPHAALGRGCPVLGGQAVDISTHWFDPAQAGTGYSVQMWDDYEYYAAYVYDRLGRPTFLAAELAAFGGADATASLQVMKGTCPTCHDELGYGPFRYEAGEMRRTLDATGLATVEIDALWEVDLSGETSWTAVDQVQTLGGPGTTQGCDP